MNRCWLLFIKFIFLLQVSVFAGCATGLNGKDEIEVIDFSPYSGEVTRSVASWHVVNSDPPFGPRDHASLIKVNGRIHLMGGFYRGHSTYQDYWISDDYGINWRLIHGSSIPLKNDLILPVLYGNKNIPDSFARFSYYDSYYWLIDNYVWYSRDGIVWHKYGKYLGNAGGTQDVFNVNHRGIRHTIDPSSNLIWDSRPNFKRSDDRQINANFKVGQGAVVYSIGNHLYIAGGINYTYALDSNGIEKLVGQEFNNFVWRSLDGINWKRVVDRKNKNIELPWVNIQWPCVVEDNKGRVFLIGGYDAKKNKNVSDVWYTVDGVHWVRYIDAISDNAVSALLPRHATSCVFDEVNNRIISIAGKGGINPDNDTSFVTKDIIGIPIP
jgi:hypothetical protein